MAAHSFRLEMGNITTRNEQESFRYLKYCVKPLYFVHSLSWILCEEIQKLQQLAACRLPLFHHEVHHPTLILALQETEETFESRAFGAKGWEPVLLPGFPLCFKEVLCFPLITFFFLGGCICFVFILLFQFVLLQFVCFLFCFAGLFACKASPRLMFVIV